MSHDFHGQIYYHLFALNIAITKCKDPIFLSHIKVLRLHVKH